MAIHRLTSSAICRSPAAFAALARRFARREDGNFVMLTGILLVPLMGIVGGVADYSMASRARSGMQSVLDSAMLAAANQQGKTSARVQTAQGFIDAQLPRFNLKNTAFEVRPSPDGQGLVGQLKGSYPTSFLRLVGVRSFDIVVETDVYTGALER